MLSRTISTWMASPSLNPRNEGTRTMAKPSSLTAQDRENLVAYLDGELDDRTARALEAKLSRDTQARAELEALKRTYNLLDFLPRDEASSQFASKTLDRLATVSPATVAVD